MPLPLPLPFPDILHLSKYDTDEVCRQHFEHMQDPFNYVQALISVRTTRSRIEHVEIANTRYLVAAGDCLSAATADRQSHCHAAWARESAVSGLGQATHCPSDGYGIPLPSAALSVQASTMLGV